ncbi:S24 family peptidase [Carnobacterium maltaromaticum]|uniref:LexA family protein n=1 Tax=Carnobacterium maltaromaticum TaxID=2751 RepID=UPI00298B6043|nr:S24 family peptidase [Carnobacterium maltaromaticum]MDW5525360.1 S24 family peptidase [Carnobacterium maltaromaticum]
MRNNDEIIDILNKLKEEKGLSLSELARRVNMAKSALSRYFNKTRQFPLNRVEDFAEVLGVSSEFILGFDANSKEIDITSIYNELKPPRQEIVYKFAERQLKEQNESPKVVQLPIIEDDKEIEILSGHQSAAGFAILGDDSNMTSTVMKASKVPNGADEVVAIKGNSMEPLITDGEQVFIRHQPSVENGEIAIVAIIDDGITCKKVYYDDAEGTVTLESVNDDYEDMVFPVEDIRIIGKVLGK